jgi:1-deoxy-D-xylulose-5-phosphate reductoisomerase
VPDAEQAIDWTQAADWRFEPLDDDAFPAVALAREAGARGGTAPAVLNGANEVCVDAFHEGRLRFVEIVDVVADVVAEHVQDRAVASSSLTVDDVLAADTWARERAAAAVARLSRPT